MKAATNAAFPVDDKELRRYRSRSLQLPDQASFRSILDAREKAKKEEGERKKRVADRRQMVLDKAGLHEQLKKAKAEVLELDMEHLERTPQTKSPGFKPPAELGQLNGFAADLALKQHLRDQAIANAKSGAVKGAKGEQGAILNPATDGPVGTKNEQQTRGFTGVGAFVPIASGKNRFSFKAGTEKLLSKETQQLLRERKLDITVLALDVIMSRLRAEMEALSEELHQLTAGEVVNSVKMIGNMAVVTRTMKPSAWTLMATGGVLDSASFFPVVDSRVPATKGHVTVAGIGELLVVKQQLKGYEGADVAHIENVLKGEAKSREHRQLRQTEEMSFRETETTSAEERELESTDRYEMSRESSNTIKEDASLKAGLSVSGSYGPTVEFSASAEGAVSRSKEEAIKTAASFSKDVTERSSRKLTERVLERSQLKVTNEVEEKNSHSVDNSAGGGHIAGVYQWVEKVYEAQLYSYGLRTLCDFMVPEPGAYLLHAISSQHAASLSVDKPPPFDLMPKSILFENYQEYIRLYGATGVEPPPPEFTTKAYVHSAGGGDLFGSYTNSSIIQIDDGYAAVKCLLGCVLVGGTDELVLHGVRIVVVAALDIIVGSWTSRFLLIDGPQWQDFGIKQGEEGSLAIGLATTYITDYSVTVEIICQRTARAVEKWQVATHAKLREAYEAKLADYEERQAAAQMQAGIAIRGKNPGLNLEMMKDELKKHCLSIITGQHFDQFGAIQNADECPRIDLYENEAEGPYVRFFEQAFEWEHMTWVTYPYFWGRKEHWQTRLVMDDPDPLFNQFIKAGYCRVVVPIRQHFDGAVDHFLTFGEIWNGGSLPTIANPLFLHIADELAERMDRPGEEIPSGEPWEVRVPTTLVHLRADDKLPKWEKDGQGVWSKV